MQKLRKDHWTEEEDKTIAELVLSFIRRTKQACGFRWNKNLRKQYIDRSAIPGEEEPSQATPNEVAHLYLKQVLTSYDELAVAYEKLKVEYVQLQTEHEEFKNGFLTIVNS